MSLVKRCFGVSERGPLHIKNQIENQDAFYISRNKDYVLALVSDGLGSKKYSDLGSKMAGLAVNNSIIKIIKEKGSLEQEKFGALLLSNIAEEWKQLVKPKAPEDCSATCLFVIITAGNIYAFRLGDGMLFFKPAGGEDAGARGAGISANSAADQGLLLQDDKSGEFSNATVSLSNENMLFSWETKKLERKAWENILLTTDGISADLQAGTEKTFAADLLDSMKNKPKFFCKIQLKKMLKNWPVPKHTDDKTLVVVDL